MLLAPHPWAPWSILGAALILFTSSFQVEVSAAIDSWYGPFYELVQAVLSRSAPVTVERFYAELSTFAGIALVAVVVGVLTRFFVSHYIFRWRTAMNEFYTARAPSALGCDKQRTAPVVLACAEQRIRQQFEIQDQDDRCDDP